MYTTLMKTSKQFNRLKKKHNKNFTKAKSIPKMGSTNKMYKYSTNMSVPAMGPLGAVAGAYAGKKIGSWVGSAGKLIGPQTEKYARKTGEYIYGTLGGGLGALYSPI